MLGGRRPIVPTNSAYHNLSDRFVAQLHSRRSVLLSLLNLPNPRHHVLAKDFHSSFEPFVVLVLDELARLVAALFCWVIRKGVGQLMASETGIISTL